MERHPLGIFVVSDDALARSGLTALVHAAPTLELVGESAENGVADVRADVLLWDVADPTSAVLGAAVSAGARVVAVVASETVALDALDAGVHAVLSRSVDARLLEAAAWTASRGGVVLDAAFEQRLVLRRGSPNQSAGDALTEREQQVITLMARGLGNKQIAAELSVSENTVKFHVNSIFEKLGASSRTEAVVAALRMGWVLL